MPFELVSRFGCKQRISLATENNKAEKKAAGKPRDLTTGTPSPEQRRRKVRTPATTEGEEGRCYYPVEEPQRQPVQKKKQNVARLLNVGGSTSGS